MPIRGIGRRTRPENASLEGASTGTTGGLHANWELAASSGSCAGVPTRDGSACQFDTPDKIRLATVDVSPTSDVSPRLSLGVLIYIRPVDRAQANAAAAKSSTPPTINPTYVAQRSRIDQAPEPRDYTLLNRSTPG